MKIPFFFKKRRVLAVLAFLPVLLFTLFVRAENATTVHLRIEGETKTYFSGNVEIGDCEVIDNSGATHQYSGKAICGLVAAANQSDFSYEFQDFGWGLFLTKIGDDATPADYSKTWNFWINYDQSSVGIDTYNPTPGQELLLSFNSYPGLPLKITAPENITAGEPAFFTVEKRTNVSADPWGWEGQWQPAPNAILRWGENNEAVVTENGSVEISPDAGILEIFSDGSGFIRSKKITVNVTDPSPLPSPSPDATPSPVASPTPDPTTEPTPSPSATPVPSPTPSPLPTLSPAPSRMSIEQRKSGAEAALRFLKERQQADGSIEGAITTDWSIIAFGSNEERAENISRNGSPSLLAAIKLNDLSKATDIERIILAVRAAGRSPKSFQGINLLDKLKEKFRNGQIGEETLINDDIFGILALIAADESVSSEIISSTVQNILSRQSQNGSWENIDITAAGIQALAVYKNNEGAIDVSSALSKARNFLKLNQETEGGFSGNSATTAWTIQAIISLNEDPNDWVSVSGKTPWQKLFSYQNADGGFGWQSKEDVSGFMTAYAIPALLGVPLPVRRLEIISTAPQTLTVPSIIIKTTPSPTPRVAGTENVKIAENKTKLATANPKDSLILDSLTEKKKNDETENPAKSNENMEIINEKPYNDTRRIRTLLGAGISNIGIGMALARLISKLRLLI